MKTLDVLLVDDDATFLDVLEGLLRTLGVERIAKASSGMEAYAHLTQPDCSVNCILCDIVMARGTGLELLQVIRAGGRGKVQQPDITFVLVTAVEDEEMRATAKDLGASGFLLKPVTPERLRDAVRPDRWTNVYQPVRGQFEQ